MHASGSPGCTGPREIADSRRMNGPAASLCLGSGCSVPDGDGDIEDGLGGRVAVLLQLEHTVLCYFNAGVVSFLTTRE